MQILQAHLPRYLPAMRELFAEYARAIEVDLCFQGFDRELAELPGRYAPPLGRLLLAREGKRLAGCVALRQIGDDTCEMKRLYVRLEFRQQGLGRRLAEKIICFAREIGYERMRLDTLASMTAAIQLYESLGFQRIPPYYNNPLGDVVFLELKLSKPERCS